MYSMSLIMNMLKDNINMPHNMGIQKPGLSALVKPMEMDMNDRSIRYRVRRERKDKRNKRASFFIMQSYPRSVDREILPPF
jgi:hypothetical protein